MTAGLLASAPQSVAHVRKSPPPETQLTAHPHSVFAAHVSKSAQHMVLIQVSQSWSVSAGSQMPPAPPVLVLVLEPPEVSGPPVLPPVLPPAELEPEPEPVPEVLVVGLVSVPDPEPVSSSSGHAGRTKIRGRANRQVKVRMVAQGYPQPPDLRKTLYRGRGGPKSPIAPAPSRNRTIHPPGFGIPRLLRRARGRSRFR